MFRATLLNQTSWSVGTVACLTTRCRVETNSPFASGPVRTSYRASWTVSDGRYMLEAWLGEVPLVDDFTVGVADCDAMIRSVQFEGPS